MGKRNELAVAVLRRMYVEMGMKGFAKSLVSVCETDELRQALKKEEKKYLRDVVEDNEPFEVRVKQVENAVKDLFGIDVRLNAKRSTVLGQFKKPKQYAKFLENLQSFNIGNAMYAYLQDKTGYGVKLMISQPMTVHPES